MQDNEDIDTGIEKDPFEEELVEEKHVLISDDDESEKVDEEEEVPEFDSDL